MPFEHCGERLEGVETEVLKSKTLNVRASTDKVTEYVWVIAHITSKYKFLDRKCSPSNIYWSRGSIAGREEAWSQQKNGVKVRTFQFFCMVIHSDSQRQLFNVWLKALQESLQIIGLDLRIKHGVCRIKGQALELRQVVCNAPQKGWAIAGERLKSVCKFEAACCRNRTKRLSSRWCNGSRKRRKSWDLTSDSRMFTHFKTFKLGADKTLGGGGRLGGGRA